MSLLTKHSVAKKKLVYIFARFDAPTPTRFLLSVLTLYS